MPELCTEQQIFNSTCKAHFLQILLPGFFAGPVATGVQLQQGYEAIENIPVTQYLLQLLPCTVRNVSTNTCVVQNAQ